MGRGAPDRADHSRLSGRSDKGLSTVRELFRTDERNTATVRRVQPKVPCVSQNQSGQAGMRPADVAGSDDSAGATVTQY